MVSVCFSAFCARRRLTYEKYLCPFPIVPFGIVWVIAQTARQRYYTEDIYFNMSEEEALSRFKGGIANYFLQPEMWLRLYRKVGEEYVRFF